MDEAKDRSGINPKKLNVFNTIFGGILLTFVVGLPAFIVWFWLDPVTAHAVIETVVDLPVIADDFALGDSIGKTIEIKIDDSVGTFDSVTEN